MGVVRTVLFYLVFGIISLILVPLMALVSLLSERIPRYGAHLWSMAFVWTARVFLGIRLVVRGRVPQTAVLVAAKHQSYYEAILTLCLFDHAAVVMKAELHRIPLWGFIAKRQGSIFVDRAQRGTALRAMLKQAQTRAAENRPIFIFPEGTRTAVGTAPPLRAGLFALYRALELPLVPVALDSGCCWGKEFAKRPGTITISFLPEIPPELPRSELNARVHAAINQDPVSAEVRS